MNNCIELYRYRDVKETQSAKDRYALIRFRSGMIRYWLFTIADTLATLAIGVCTLFCIYLAYTML